MRLRAEAYAAVFVVFLVGCVGGDDGGGNSTGVCGDGVQQPGELCDATDFGGLSCQELGFDGGHLVCQDCAIDATGCVIQQCGNGVVEGTEACDGSDFIGQSCASLGLGEGELVCNACALVTDGCGVDTCGNSTIDEGELCDGSELDGATCESLGFTDGGTVTCASDCMALDTSGCCGDGTISATESCDDGNDVEWDGCGSCAIQEFGVNVETSGEQRTPAVAMAPDGSFVVVWESDGQDGSGYGIIARRFDTTGQPLGPEFVVPSTTDGDQLEPAVAINASGQFAVAWRGYHASSDAIKIYGRRFDDQGFPYGDDFVMSYTGDDSNHSDPDVAIGGNGQTVFVYRGSHYSYSNQRLRYSRYDEFGQGYGSGSLSTGTWDSNPAVAMADNGAWVAAYTTDYDLSVRYSPAGGTLGSGFRASTSNTFPSSGRMHPDVAVDANGFIVTWTDPVTSADGDSLWIAARIWDSAGIALGPEFKVNTYTANAQTRSIVGLAADGSFAIAWQSDSQDGAVEGVYLQRFTAAGAPDGLETQVNLFTPSDQAYPALDMAADGRHIVVWESGVIDGSAHGIFAQRYLATGEAIGVLSW